MYIYIFISLYLSMYIYIYIYMLTTRILLPSFLTLSLSIHPDHPSHKVSHLNHILCPHRPDPLPWQQHLIN